MKLQPGPNDLVLAVSEGVLASDLPVLRAGVTKLLAQDSQKSLVVDLTAIPSVDLPVARGLAEFERDHPRIKLKWSSEAIKGRLAALEELKSSLEKKLAPLAETEKRLKALKTDHSRLRRRLRNLMRLAPGAAPAEAAITPSPTFAQTQVIELLKKLGVLPK